MKRVYIADLTPGEQYHVTMEDCCVEGSFTSILDVIALDGEYVELLDFANGVILTNAMGCTFELVDDS